MKLLKINDPLYNSEKKIDTPNKDIAIGIDLGTTNSVVAVYLNGEIQVITFNNNNNFLPSVVAFWNNEVFVGNEAIHVFETQKNCTFFRSFKRLMGKKFTDIKEYIVQHGLVVDSNSTDNELKLLIKQESNSQFRSVTPEMIASFILLKIKTEVEKQLKLSVNKAVITVPAYFNETERIATKNAAKLAGLDVLRLINEPTSAALAYGLDEGIHGKYLVYDLGGGTFDVSLLQLDKGVFRVIGTKGDLFLGGDDFDYLIASAIIKKINTKYNINVQYDQNLLLKSKFVKEQLSKEKSIDIELSINNVVYNIIFTQDELNIILLPVLQQTMDLCKSVLNDAQLSINDLTGIILVGGSSKLPLIKKLIQQVFNIDPKCLINPEEVVAIGAAYQAANLSGVIKKSLLLDIIPLSLGIETYGGITEKIIFKNSPIPISKTQIFTTFKNNQTSLMLHVVQGERELAKDNHSVAKFTLKGIPPLPAGVARVEINFTVDADSLLTVTAREQTTNVFQNIEVKPTFGLSLTDIKDIIIDGINNAESDINTRILETSKVESLNLINLTQNALNEDKTIISLQEVEKIQEVITKLQIEIDNNNLDNIKSLKEELILATNNLAQKRMDKSIKLALENKNINDI